MAAGALFAQLSEQDHQGSEGDQEAQAPEAAPGHGGFEGREEGWGLAGFFEGGSLGVEERGQAEAEPEQSDGEPEDQT